MNRRERRIQERLAKKSLAQHPTQAIEHYDLGVALENRGKPEEAAELYRRALEIDPNLVDAHNNLGNILKDLGKLDQAIDCYRRTIEIDPDYAMGHYNLGNALQDQGKLDEAVTCYYRALEINPDEADVYNNLGNALRAQRKPDDAMACYYRVLAIDFNHALAYYNLGNVFKDQKKPEGAADCFRRALAINPNYAAAHFNLGNVLKDQKKLEEAIACYRRTIEILPGFAMAHFHLGEAFKKQRKLEQAIESYHRAIEIDPDYADAYNNLGNAYQRRDRTEQAAACFRRALEIDPDHPDARLNSAKDHSFVPGDPLIDGLKALLERKRFSKDKKNQVLFALGKAHDDLGLYAEAFSYFTKGNEEMAEKLRFDAAGHRRDIEEVRRSFPEAPKPLGMDGGEGARLPVFVLGMSRSGKTLVESVLAQHRDVYAAGEKHEWISAVETILKRHEISEPFPRCMAVLTGAQIREMGDLYMEGMSLYAPKLRVLVNTLPGNYRYIPPIFQGLPSAKVVFCRRDPLDHCLFVYIKRYAEGNRHSYDLKNVAAYYTDYYGLLAHWQKLYGEHILEVRYEDLVRAPAETGARLFAYCGLDFDPALTPDRFGTDEIGGSQHYEPYLGPLRQALGELAR